MKNTANLFLLSLLMILTISSCQKKDKPELGEYLTDDNQVLLPGDLRFFASFNGTDGVSPRWNASDSISKNPALLFPAVYEPGVSGNSIKVDDNAALLYLNANDIKTATSLSIAFWMKNTDKGRTEFVFSLVDERYGWGKSAAFLMMEHGSATETTFKFGLMDQWLEFPDGSKLKKPLLDGQWHHMALVYDQTTSKVAYYFDGNVVENAPASATDVKKDGAARGALDFSAVKNLVIGGWNKQAGLKGPTDDWVKSFTGNLDQFRIYNKAISAADVKALFTSKQ